MAKQPKCHFFGTQVGLDLAEDITKFNQRYEAARSSFRQSGWYAGHYWHNREHHFPSLFADYYDRVYRQIGEGLAHLSNVVDLSPGTCRRRRGKAKRAHSPPMRVPGLHSTYAECFRASRKERDL